MRSHLLIDSLAQMQQAEGMEGLRALIARAGELGVLLLILADGAIPVADLLTAGAPQSIIRPVTGDVLMDALRGLYAGPADHRARVDQAA